MAGVNHMKVLRYLSLAAFLGITPANAQGVKAGEDKTKVYGSDVTMRLLGPFLPTLRRIADADILVFSPDDLTTAAERARMITKGPYGYEEVTGITDDEKARRYEALLQRHRGVIPQSYFDTPDAKRDQFAHNFDAIVLGYPSALSVMNEKTGRRFCVVKVPLRTRSIRNYLVDAARLPRRLAPQIRTQSDPKLMFQSAVGHEGTHCMVVSGKRPENIVDRAIAELAEEMRADKVSDDELKANNPATGNSVEVTLAENRHARSIYHIRASGTVFDDLQSLSYIDYGAPLFDQSGQQHSHAAMIYAARFITQHDRKFLATLRADDMKRYGLEAKSNTFGSDGPYQMHYNIKGRILQLDYPELQYAHLKHIQQQIESGALTTDQIAKLGAVVPMIKAYTEGMEALLPEVVRGPLVTAVLQDLQTGRLTSTLVQDMQTEAARPDQKSAYDRLKDEAVAPRPKP